MARRGWNAAKHPRWPKGGGRRSGRFRPTYVKGSVARNTKFGRGGKYVGVKSGAEFRTPRGGQVLVKGIVGYSPPATPSAAKLQR